MKKRILIAGGAGFIGSHLCRRYLEKDFSVTCLDNLYTGSLDNIRELETHPQFQFVRHDISEPFEGSYDFIFNFACPASPVHYQSDPVFTWKTSVFGTYNLLELARRTSACFLQASTSEVYGDPEQHPQSETYWGRVNPIGIRSCYDEGKRAAESLCFDYIRSYKTDVRVVRIFNTYGPFMNKEDGRVVSNFIVQALSEKPITLYGNGQQTRSFCYVSDLISAIENIASVEKEKINGPYNIGNDQEFTMEELARKVLAMTGSSSRLEYHPLPKDDPSVRKPLLTKVKDLIPWTPKVTLDEGLEKTIAYFKEIPGRSLRSLGMTGD